MISNDQGVGNSDGHFQRNYGRENPSTEVAAAMTERLRNRVASERSTNAGDSLSRYCEAHDKGRE